VEWESGDANTDNADCFRTDPSQKSFIFTLKNPRNFPPRKFPLNHGKAIYVGSWSGPYFYDIVVWNDCNRNASSSASGFGNWYRNDTGLDRETFFTGSPHFTVKEIEVFEITD
jgi:hypothetical protein